jgi:amino acid transporter
MKVKKLLTSVLACSVVALFMAAPVTLAGDGAPDPLEQLRTIGEEGYGSDEKGNLAETIGSLINQALAVLGIIIVVLIIYGGFLWMTAGGNSDQVDKAKKIIINATIGLVIILAAYSITYFVVQSIMNATVSS